MENTLKPLLVQLLGEELTAYRLSKLTGLSEVTAGKALNNPAYYPSQKVAETLCRTFNIQPGSFLYWRASGKEG